METHALSAVEEVVFSGSRKWVAEITKAFMAERVWVLTLFLLRSQYSRMKKLVQRLWPEEGGEDLTEYALLMVLLSLAAVAFLTPLATAVNDVFSNAADALTLVISPPKCCD